MPRRVGLHSAVVWNRLNRSPSAASLSIVGDGTPPPNVLNWPYPASSSRISTTFGAPLGAWTGCGNCGASESRYVRPTLPGNGNPGKGSTLGVPFKVASALGFSWAKAGDCADKAASQPEKSQ